MKNLGLLITGATLFALMTCVASPAAASSPVEVHMTFDRGANQMTSDSPDGPFFDNPYNAVGNVSIRDIDLAAGSATLAGLHVEFAVDVCSDLNCTTIIQRLHYQVRFDDTPADASLNDPNDPDSLSVTGLPSSGTVHRDGSTTDSSILFGTFSYSKSATTGYSLLFVFYSAEFNANITVTLTGPPIT